MKKNRIILLLMSFLVFFADQFSKLLIRKNFLEYDSIDVIGEFFKLTFIYNHGMVFGIQPFFSKWILNIITFAITVYLLYYIGVRKNEKLTLENIGFALILGGGLGNLYDRIFLGKVVDFLDFGINHYRWYTFNIADSAVTVGIVLIAIYEIFFNKSEQNKLEDETIENE